MRREASPATARLLLGPAILVGVYLVLRAVFVVQAEPGGLLTPSGSVSLGLAFLGLLVLGLRLVVLFVLAPVVTYRLIARLGMRAGSPPKR